MYQGITNISVGIIKVLNIAMNISFFPGNSNFAKVYPTNESKKRTETVVEKAIIKLLTNHLGNEDDDKMYL